MPHVIYSAPILPQILGCSLWSRLGMLESAERRKHRLIIYESWWSYLAPFLRYDELQAEKRGFYLLCPSLPTNLTKLPLEFSDDARITKWGKDYIINTWNYFLIVSMYAITIHQRYRRTHNRPTVAISCNARTWYLMCFAWLEANVTKCCCCFSLNQTRAVSVLNRVCRVVLWCWTAVSLVCD